MCIVQHQVEPGANITLALPHFTRFTTDELLLREMADDPLLHRYNFVIIDEVQNRTLATDLLLALFKLVIDIPEHCLFFHC